MHFLNGCLIRIAFGVILLTPQWAISTEEKSAENTIHWYNFNISPGGISSGPLHQQGLGYLFFKEYEKALPEYKHHFKYANVVRMRAVIEREANSCITYIFHLPEYTKYRYWGPVNYIAPPNRIITRPSVAALLTDREVSLSDMLAKKPFRLGVMAGRAYRVPGILQANKDNPNLILKHTANASIYRMIQSQRLDYTLGDWVELAYMEESLNMKGAFVTFPMKEVVDYTPNFVNCTRNAWGKKIIDKLHSRFHSNSVIREKMLPPIMRWVRDSEKEQYQKEYSRYLDTHFGGE